jgi:hypothetical protein
MNNEILATLLHSLSDRAERVQGKIDRANANLNAGRALEFWQSDRAYWLNRMKEIDKAREVLLAM